MKMYPYLVFWAIWWVPFTVSAADMIQQRPQSANVGENSQFSYRWEVMPVGQTAQLLTLFSQSKVASGDQNDSVPLVSVLRDTLGDSDPENDRVTSVWLLSSSRLNWGQRVLSAIPFFYWRIGRGSTTAGKQDLKPLLDLTAPAHPVLSNIGRDVVQWTMLDPMTMSVRATSRAYRANELDGERVHLEEAISYLRQAPVSDDQASLTQPERDTVIARLELRKSLLGGLVSAQRTASLGQEAGFEQERIRSRNWEILRQCADKTGLLFEPLDLAGEPGDYAMLWFPVDASEEPNGTPLKLVWKLLNIKDPRQDERVKNWHGRIYSRSFAVQGAGGPAASTSNSQQLRVIPLAVYSLTYPKAPLLVVDFRDELHLKRHELTQRSINELTSGVIGISHFTNWYYYFGAAFYDFVAGRHGAAVNQAARLDSYSQFRVALALDRGLDPQLRNEMQARIDSLSVNPLDASADREMQAAKQRYQQLVQASDSDQIAQQLDKQRRSELASFGESEKAQLMETVLHSLSFGLYSHRAKPDPDSLAHLDCERRVQYDLNFVDSMGEAGTAPEVAHESSRIRASVSELSSLMPYVDSRQVRHHAQASLTRLEGLSQDADVRAECLTALASLKRGELARASNPSVVGVAAFAHSASVTHGSDSN